MNDEQYEKELVGMTRQKVVKDALVEAQARLCTDIGERLTGDVAAFLLSLHDAEPDFDLIGLPTALKLPAIQWKLVNLETLRENNPKKHAVQRVALKALFR